MTIREAAAAARRQLEAAGIPLAEATLDAELFARDALRCDRASYLARLNEPMPPDAAAAYSDAIARRARREPVAYIRGRQEFYGREFEVTPAVLIPRPESELLIDEARLLLPALAYTTGGHGAVPLVIDIGTGSGCLVTTLALEFPKARYVATDISADALAVARANAQRLGIADRIQFIEGAYFGGAEGPFHLVVTNPPYVAETARPALPPEVVDHEPATALFGGADGMRDIREIVAQADTRLDADGTLLMEIGFDQLAAVSETVNEAANFAVVRTRTDLQGHPRVAVIRRRR